MRREDAVVPRTARDGAREGADRGHGALLRRPRPARGRHDAAVLQAALAEGQRAVQRDAGHHIAAQRPRAERAGGAVQGYHEVRRRRIVCCYLTA